MKKLQVILMILSVPMIGTAQEFKCDDSKGNYYQITAESGLNMRQEPNLSSKKIVTIPFKSKVFACEECNECKSDTIEGKKALWKKVFFQGYEGFVFGGFLDREIESILTSDWWAIGFDKRTLKEVENHFGIYKDGINGLRVRKIIESDTMIDKSELEVRDLMELEKGKQPLFVISGIDLINGQSIRGREINQMLYIGETISFGSSCLFSTGNPEFSENTTFPFSKIKDYKLILRQSTKGGDFKEQTLFNNDFYAWQGGRSYEGGIFIKWIGDIDKDNKMDILLTHSTHYACWDVILFLSTKAKEDELVGQASKYQVCGC